MRPIYISSIGSIKEIKSYWKFYGVSFLNIFSILTEGKTPVIKERLNKSATCSEISFFRINIYSISYINYLGEKP